MHARLLALARALLRCGIVELRLGAGGEPELGAQLALGHDACSHL